MLKLQELFEELSEVTSGRVKPNFQTHHVLKALMVIDGRSVGRGILAKRLSLTEMSTRTLIKRMKASNLVRVDRRGCKLTDKSINLLNEWLSVVPFFKTNLRLRVKLDKYNAVALIREGSLMLKRIGVLGLRDLLIKNGGSAALIMEMTSEGLKIPLVSEVDERLIKEVERRVKPRVGDLIMISFSNSEASAEKSIIDSLAEISKNYD